MEGRTRIELPGAGHETVRGLRERRPAEARERLRARRLERSSSRGRSQRERPLGFWRWARMVARRSPGLQEERHDRRRLQRRRPAAGRGPQAAARPGTRNRFLGRGVTSRVCASRVRSVLAGRGFMLLPGRCVRGAPARVRARLRLRLGRGARGAGARLPRLARALGRAAARGRLRGVPGPRRACRDGPRRARRRSFVTLFGFAWVLLLAVYACRSGSRACSRSATRQASPASSATAAGGRYRCPRRLRPSSRCCSSSAQRSSRPSRGRPRRRPAPVELLLQRPLLVVPVRLSPLAGRVAGRAPPAV